MSDIEKDWWTLMSIQKLDEYIFYLWFWGKFGPIRSPTSGQTLANEGAENHTVLGIQALEMRDGSWWIARRLALILLLVVVVHVGLERPIVLVLSRAKWACEWAQIFCVAFCFGRSWIRSVSRSGLIPADFTSVAFSLSGLSCSGSGSL